MSQELHGGDIYKKNIDMDFSVSINPCPLPESVTDALHSAVKNIGKYPDLRCEKLINLLSERYSVSNKNIIAGNGSSELFMALAHAFRLAKVLIPVPSFYGYEYAFSENSEKLIFYPLKEEDEFKISEDLFEELDKGYDFLILANPNNPTGKLTGKETVEKIVKKCLEKNTKVLLDECFIELSDENNSLIPETEKYPNLFVVRSFTKTFAIPDLRIGYLVCSDEKAVEKVKKHIPEWSVSQMAQDVACECMNSYSYVEESRRYIEKERCFLEEGLRGKGYKVFISDTNYILFKNTGVTKDNLYKRMLDKKILIRDCSNFRGLNEGFYRIAVKTREENERFLRLLNE
ncbi:MAG: aminotransferase class I/II-fold pyridoxal phosphate-dependent enzyme [Lachnospiraceae bacterium]|nr:aminotransferase class I/II-fold pyridoxal phosphate-dependent enzyme [Lachnospiraceae bacterium]